MYNKPVRIYRIGDTQNDKFTIPKDLIHIVSPDRIFKYCTKPELEILLIINENKYDEYKKSGKRPKTFEKENICYNKKYCDGSTDYIRSYYCGERIQMLMDNLKEYKRLKKQDKNELYLFDLLNISINVHH